MKTLNWIRTSICFALLAVWAFCLEPDASKKSDTGSNESRVVAADPIDREIQNADKAEKLDDAISRAVSSVPVSLNGDKQPEQKVPQKEESFNFRFATDLFHYARLRSKVILNDEAKAQKDSLIRNVELLKALEFLLKSTATDPKLFEMQNDAIDLLLDARSSVSGSAAEGVLRSVIEDNQVENENVDMTARKSLAGLKAEILYQWSSQDPSRADEMRAWLPGPVSEKIWRNIVEAQTQNELESSLEP